MIEPPRVLARRRAAAAFAALCAAGIPAWWLALFQSPSIRSMFVPDAAWPGFRHIVWFDMTLATLTAIVAIQLARARESTTLVGAACAAWGLAAAYSIGWARVTGASPLGPALMIAAVAGLTMVWYGVVSPRASRAR